MSFDLSWLWNWIVSVVDRIRSFFSSIWDAAQAIANTGQGVFAGFSVLASALWDAIRSGVESFANAFVNAFINAGSFIRQAFETFGEWFWKALAAIPNAVYTFGQWLYNAVNTTVDAVRNFLSGALNWFISVVSGLVDSINSWYEGYRFAINTWWSNLVSTIRAKLRRSIASTVAIHFTWKGLEKASETMDFKRLLLSPLYMLGSVIAGEIIGAIVDAMIPAPVQPLELLPPATLPPVPAPSLVLAPPAALPAPAPPPAPVVGYGLPVDMVTVVRAVSDYSTNYVSQYPLATLSADSTTASTDNYPSIITSIETELA